MTKTAPNTYSPWPQLTKTAPNTYSLWPQLTLTLHYLTPPPPHNVTQISHAFLQTPTPCSTLSNTVIVCAHPQLLGNTNRPPTLQIQQQTQPYPTSAQKVNSIPTYSSHHFRPHTIRTDNCSICRKTPTTHSDLSHHSKIVAYTIATPSPPLQHSPVHTHHQLHDLCFKATYSRTSSHATK